MPKSAKKSAPVRLSRAEQNTKRNAELLDAAWALFCERGYDGTTMEEVCKYAGVSKYPVYYAFGDKQNLFLELWKRNVNSILEILESRFERGAKLRFNLEALAQYAADDHKANPHKVDGLYLVVQTVALSRPDIAEKLQAVSTSIVDSIADVIESSTLERGQKLRYPAQAAAIHVIAIINGLSTMRAVTKKVPFTASALLETLLTATTHSAKA